MANRNFSRGFIFTAAALLLATLFSAPLLAQDAPPTNTDLKFHKFVPAIPPENNASAASARQATTSDAVNGAATQQIQLLLQEKSARTPAQQKIDSNVLFTIRMMRGEQAAPGFQSLYTGVDLDDQNRIVVDIVADVTPDLLQKLQSAGALVLSSYPDYRAIRAIVPPNQIESIAASPDVSFIGRKARVMTSGFKREPQNYVLRNNVPAYGFEARAAHLKKQIVDFLQQRAGTNSTTGVINTGQGSVTTEGDATHLAARSRGLYGVNGSGLKIGVLSDSANATGAVTNAQATGDMPPTCPGPGGPCLTILQDSTGNDATDEGTAMMEIIYDMAPGASLFFATANGGEAPFAANIQALRTAGCDIIVDDVFYFGEPVFQDGIVAQAVTSVTASGALYFSSAGNEGNKDAGTAGYFEGDFNDSGSPSFVFPGGTKAGTIHNFGAGFGDPVTAPGEGYVLQWADPFNAPTNDYDLFYINSGGIVLASSTNAQNGGLGQIAFEEIDPPSNGSLGDQLVVFKSAAANPVLFGLKTLRGTLTVSTSGETWGHSAVTAAFSVAAAPAAGNFGAGFPSGPFPGSFNALSPLEPFTSDGPRRIIFNPDGTPITPGNFSSSGGTVRNKPDLTAADGVSTTLPIASGLNPFFGTSAAAPHAAAIAALVKSAAPTLTPDQIRSTLTTTALSFPHGTFSRNAGFGIVMADGSLASLGLTGFADLEILAVTANENPGNGNGIIDPGEGASLAIQLGNIGGVTSATGITAVLTTSTPGVTITQPSTSAFADIPASSGGVNNLSPFTFTVASNVPCALNINFVLTLTYAGGPAPTKAIPFSVQTGAFQIKTSLGNAPPPLPSGITWSAGGQSSRLFRNAVPSTCAAQKPFPGIVQTATRVFDTFTFTAAQAGCLQTVLSGNGGQNLLSSAYSFIYAPANIATNYLGDAGSSGTPQTFSISTVAGNSYVIVVEDVTANGTGSSSGYTLQIPSCAITNPSTVNHPPIAVAKDVTVTAATPGGTVAVSIDNGSSDPDVGDTITKTQTPPGPYAIGVTSVLLTVVDSKGATSQATANVTVLNPGPDLLITQTHTGNFTPGQVGATFTIAVESVGNQPTAGTVTVVDTLPTGLTATAFTGTGWTCTFATLTCTRGESLATGSIYPPITLTVNVAAFPPPIVANTATISGGGDVNPNNNVAIDRATVIVNPDLTVAVSHIGNFTQGQSNAFYTIVVTNIGTAPTNALVEFLDTLPAGFSIVSFGSGSGWSCSLSGGLETCERPDPLAPNSSYPPLIINVRIATNTAASVTNLVTVFGGGELNTANDTATDPTTVNGAPNLTIVGTHTGNFSQSQPGNYTLTVSNIGFAPSSGTVTVTDSLPPAFTATAMSGSGWTCTVATATCTRTDALAAAASYPAITLTGTVSATAPTSFSNSVTVSGGGELFLNDDSSSDPTTINQLVDMTVSSSHVGIFFPGEIGAVYTLVATNIGFSSTTAIVTLQDNLSGMTATAMSGPGWSCNVSTVVCSRSDVLAGNASYPPITLTVNVQEPALAQFLTNVAIVSGGGETNTQNDTGSDVTTISVNPDLTITKSHVGNFTSGQIGASYSIVVSNGGINPVSGPAVTVVDTLPAGLSATAISGSGWTCTLGSLTCTRSDLLRGGSSYPAITVTVNVSPTASGTLTNTATVSGGGETNTANDTAMDPTVVVPPTDLTITKSHSGSFTQGQQSSAGYTITVTNSGTQPTSGSIVTVVDTLPASLTAASISGTGWTCTLATVTCTRTDVLAALASYSPITVNVSVANNAPASVTNTATVSGGGELNTANDTATDVTTITQLPDMTIAAAIAPPGFFLKGQTGAQFSFTATNSGALPTSAPVTVLAMLPSPLTATAIAGTGWTCTLATLTCTRVDVLQAGQPYPSILVTMNVDANSTSPVTSTATVSGGGEVLTTNDSVTFPTTITTPPAVTLSATSLAFPNQGVNTTSAAKQITATNSGGQTLIFPGLFATVLSNTTNWAIAPGTTCANGVSVAGGGQCVINITFTPTTVGSAGPDTLTLSDNATPSAQTITLTGTGIDFVTGGPVAPATVTAGQTATFTITLTPGAGGFANAVTFSAIGLPSASSASFSPSSLTPGSTATSTTLSIATTARGILPPSAKRIPSTPPQFVLWILALASVFFTLAFLASARSTRFHFINALRPRFAPAMLIATVLITATVIAGCGGGGVTTPPPPSGTPAGTSTITVTAQSGALIHATTVTLTVQ